MAEKYPLQIWVAARAGMSLTCAADLRSPEEKDMRNSPMEMHTRASVFRMAIASSQNGSVVANIPAKDVPSENGEASLRRMVYGMKFNVIKSCLFRNLE